MKLRHSQLYQCIFPTRWPMLVHYAINSVDFAQIDGGVLINFGKVASLAAPRDLARRGRGVAAFWRTSTDSSRARLGCRCRSLDRQTYPESLPVAHRPALRFSCALAWLLRHSWSLDRASSVVIRSWSDTLGESAPAPFGVRFTSIQMCGYGLGSFVCL